MPGVHYDPMETQCPTSDKASARLLPEVAAAHGCPIEHMDILNPYVLEPAVYHNDIYVRGLRHSDGTFSYSNAIGLL